MNHTLLLLQSYFKPGREHGINEKYIKDIGDIYNKHTARIRRQKKKHR